MHSDEMNKIEVRNVEKYPLFAVFYLSFLFDGKPKYFYLFSKSNKNWTSCVKFKKIHFIGEIFFFFVVFFSRF